MPKFNYFFIVSSNIIRQVLQNFIFVKTFFAYINSIRRMIGGCQNNVKCFLCSMPFNILIYLFKQYFIRAAPGVAAAVFKITCTIALVKILRQHIVFNIAPRRHTAIPKYRSVPGIFHNFAYTGSILCFIAFGRSFFSNACFSKASYKTINCGHSSSSVRKH